MNNYMTTYSFVCWWRSWFQRGTYKQYTCMYTYIHFDTYTSSCSVYGKYLCISNYESFHEVRGKTYQKKLTCGSQQESSFEIGRAVKYFLGMYCSLISAYFGQTRIN